MFRGKYSFLKHAGLQITQQHFTISYPQSHYPPSACIWGSGWPSWHPDRCHTAWERASLIALHPWHLSGTLWSTQPFTSRYKELSDKHSDGMMCGETGEESHGGLAADESWVTTSQIDNFLHLSIRLIWAKVAWSSSSCFIANALQATYAGMDIF